MSHRHEGITWVTRRKRQRLKGLGRVVVDKDAEITALLGFRSFIFNFFSLSCLPRNCLLFAFFGGAGKRRRVGLDMNTAKLRASRTFRVLALKKEDNPRQNITNLGPTPTNHNRGLSYSV